MIIWITGITASGKSTLSLMLYNELKKNEKLSVLRLDGDELRNKKNFFKGHDLHTRWKNLKIIVNLIKEELLKYDIFIVATVSHVKEMRQFARDNLDNFHEIYLSCDSKICQNRDYKGLYDKAKLLGKNDSEMFPGVTVPYEISKKPELVIDTGNLSINLSFKKLLSYVNKKGN